MNRCNPSGKRIYPETIRQRDFWVTWILDEVGRKRPVAPWKDGHAYPTEWRGDLPEDEKPHTDFNTAKDWAEFNLSHTDLGLPPGAKSESLGIGILLPNDRPPITERITLIDWDDVVNPETNEVHPIAAKYIKKYGGYVELSTSGTGLHQFVIGGLPKRGKFIAPIDDEPFIGDDLPQVELYDGGRHVAMTGRHVEGADTTVIESQEYINEIITEFAAAEKDAGHRVYDPDNDAASNHSASNTHSNASDIPEPKTGEYLGPSLETLQSTQPENRSFEYHATIEAFYRGAGNSGGYAHIQNWRLEGFAAALGKRENLTAKEVKRDLAGAYLDATDVKKECIHRTPHRVDYAFKRVEQGRLEPPTNRTLTQYGLIPPAYNEAEFTSYLPHGVRNLAQEKTSGWDWQHSAAQSDATITVEDARQRTTNAIKDAYESSDRVLIEALPTMGKSYGCIKAAADSDENITVLTGRGNKEQYEQFRQWCEEHNLDYYTLPSFTRDCLTANGEHGEDWQRKVKDWYRRGATPQTIHKYAEDVLGRPLPCQEHKGQSCTYAGKWDFNPDKYDVLIGHYTHAHKAKVTQSRTVVFDEFPGDSFENTFGASGILPGAVSSWLQRTEEVPFENWTDLDQNRNDQQRRADALLYFEETGAERDELAVLEDSISHALAPTIVFALLITNDLGNGIERADIRDGGQKAVHNQAKNELSLLTPPDLDYASGVVALDGTPTVDMWEDCLGERLNHREVLQGNERAEYIKEALNLNLIRTSEYIKPYNSAGHVNVEADATLLNEIAALHGETPGVITTSTAEDCYRSAEDTLPIAETKHYGNVLGSNEFKTKRVGAVIGSNHYGDHYIKKWAAYAGEAAERGEGKGADLDYGEYGNKVLQHMQQHDTLQAAMRWGRDGNGAVVYVHTDTLPDWVPLAGEGRVLKTWSDGMRSVIDALERLDSPTTKEIVEYPTVDISRQQVFEHCETLRDKGVLSRRQNPEDGRGVVWLGDELHRLGEHGDAELPSVELDELEDDEVRQLARCTTYTSDLTNFDQTKSESEANATISTQSAQSPDRSATSPRPPD